MKANDKCPDCGGLIAIRNPTGKCDHLYYPDCKELSMKKINSLKQLKQAADNRKAIVITKTTFSPKWGYRVNEHMPAAVILHWQGVAILRMIESGMYIYEKKKGVKKC